MKKSIRNRINYLIIISLITLSVAMIGVNVVIIDRFTERNSEVMMKETCDSQALQLDTQFKLIEQSVQNIYRISENMRPDVSDLTNEALSKDYIERFQELAISIANGTDGALAVYYRMNPELTKSGTAGFFYVKSIKNGVFEANEITDLLEYDRTDVEHVGWYYIPADAGKPVWIEPYYNANIGVYMISYVVPVFDGDTLIGVVGMDVDFNSLKNIAEHIDIYESDGAVLCNMPDGQVYYNECGLFGNEIPDEIYEMFLHSDTSENVFSYELYNERYGMYYQTLQNNMKLLIYAKESEINYQRYSSLLTSSIIFVISFVITILFALRTSRRIVKPIGRITEATKQYAAGDWDATVSCDTGDELQELTENITIMALKTKEYIEYIHGIAKKDALTGIRNKTDYLYYVEKIKTELIDTKTPFAVVVFDVNNLKMVNDNYGHEKGDELIIAASQFICSRYAHSPVFRIGGDEFVAILDSSDYETRETIIEMFQKDMLVASTSENARKVCIASGMATFDAEAADYEELFALADRRMYENKKQLKHSVSLR